MSQKHLESALGTFGYTNLNGMLPRDWARLLRRHRRDIGAAYLPRVLQVSAFSLINAAVHAYERRRHGRTLASVEVPPPLFILGHYRSGTTLLHNLLAEDGRWAFPNLVEVLFPHTFLTTEAALISLAAPLMPKTRLVDQVPFGLDLPQEEELALMLETGLSPFLGWALPTRWDDYAVYFTLDDAPEHERARWKQAFMGFLAKLTVKHGRPLVLKSPLNTCRLPLLTELFPDARFVHIHRDPFTVYQSVLHFEHFFLHSAVALDRPRPELFHDWIIRRYKIMHQSYFAHRDSIPPGRLCEVRFSDLERDPISTLRGIYRDLDLGGFEHAEPRLRAYLERLGGHEKNSFPPLSPGVRDEIVREWGFCFDAWGYPTGHAASAAEGG